MLNQRGDTLVEMMVAMLIGIVGFLGMMAVQITSMTGTSAAKNETTAVNLGQGLTEKLTFASYTSASLSGGLWPANSPTVHPTATDITNGFVRGMTVFADNSSATLGAPGAFTRTWSVMDNYSGTGQKMVSVQVTWGNASAGQKQRSFRFVKSQNY